MPTVTSAEEIVNMALTKLGHDEITAIGESNKAGRLSARWYVPVRDALLRLMGAAPQPLPSFRVRSLSPVRKKPGRTEYQRAILGRGADGVVDARITGNQGSGVLRSMSVADCMMVLAHESGDVAVGDWVEVIPFSGLL